jgi:hypothetical protein
VKHFKGVILSQYNLSAFAPTPVLLQADKPEYLYGSYSDTTAPSRLTVTNVALTSDVATLTVQVREGNIPTVGSLISVIGTQSTSGLFNVSNVDITAVSINATSGAGTVSFALTHADVTSAANSGQALVPVPIVGEAIQAGSSAPATSPYNDPNTDGARTYTAQVYFQTIPTAVTVTLQAAQFDNDADYQSLGTVATVAAGAVTLSQAQFQLENNRFLRFATSGLTGTGVYAAALLA